MTDKAVFITGGTTGIGFELAKLYAANGYNVGICGRDASKLPADFLNDHKTIQFYHVDVCDKQQIRDAVTTFITFANGLDIIIANAGRSTGSKQQIPDFDVVANIIDTNLNGVCHTFDAALPYFLQHKSGHCVAIASVAGYVGLPGAAAYSSSKAGVLALCESLSLDLPKYGIDVTTIAPGFIDTPLTQKNDHKMPFIIPVEKAAKKIKKAIDNKKVFYCFPWQMRTVMTLARCLPRSWYRKIMSLEFVNYSRGL